MTHSQDCIFCKIISREIKSTPIFETDTLIVLNDLHPKAPIHQLIIPKKHITSIHEISDEEKKLSHEIFTTAQILARKLPAPHSFNLLSNNGIEAGQSIMHMHVHFISGKNLFTGF